MNSGGVGFTKKRAAGGRRRIVRGWMPAVPPVHEIIRIYNLRPDDFETAKNIRDALKQADKREAALVQFRAANSWPKTLRFSHGTSWENAQAISRSGFEPSATGCLGPGIYVGRTDKALRFARNSARHGGDCGGLVEVAVTIRQPKFVAGNDYDWQAEGYDACRAEYTSVSDNMEWCIKSPSQCIIVKIIKVPLDPSIPVGPTEEPQRPLQQYICQLVAAISAAGGRCPLNNLGAQRVPRPDGVNGRLKSIIRAHPNVFVLHDTASGGGGETVELAPVVTPSPPVPGAPSIADAEGQVATEEETAIGFGQHLHAHPSVAASCSSKPQFAEQFKRWKSREAANGRKWRGAAARILWKLSRFGAAKSAQLGVARIKGVVGQRIYFGASGMAAVAEALVEKRPQVEADKFGIRVTPLALFDGTTIIRRGAVLERTLTVTNESNELRELISARLMGRGGSEFTVSFTGEDGALVFMPGQMETLRVMCRPVRLGMSRDVLHLNFGSFSIGRCNIPHGIQRRGPLMRTAPQIYG